MQSKSILSILSVVLVALSFSMAAPYALGYTHRPPPPPPSPVIPSACVALLATGWSTTPMITVTMKVSNDEDSGINAYWALDNYQNEIIVWENTGTSPATFCAYIDYVGTFQTFATAVSPQNGVTEPRDGSGDLNGGIVQTFTATPCTSWTTTYPATSGCYAPPPCSSATGCPTSGFVGFFDFGGTKSDVLLNTYTTQKGDPTYVDWVSFYFQGFPANQPPYNTAGFQQPVWAFTYTLRTGFGAFTNAGYGDLWVDANGGNFGDIVT